MLTPPTKYQSYPQNPHDIRSLPTLPSGASNHYTYGREATYPKPNPNLIPVPITKISSWTITQSDSTTITNNFEYDYDTTGHLTSTGEWNITSDNLGRIQTATGYGVLTEHTHDDFGNNISHQASPSQTSPSSYPPATMLNWSFPPLPTNKIPTQTTDGAETWWQYTKNREAQWVGKAPGGDKITLTSLLLRKNKALAAAA
jgi:hypothetical protein